MTALEQAMGSCEQIYKSANPKVSIGMPVYNEETFIRQAVDSLLAQTFQDFELIISDNASTDRTPEICKEYAEGEQRIRYFRQPENMGGGPNFRFVLSEARGEYFMYAAGNDWWEAGFLEGLVSALERNDDFSMAFCPYDSVYEGDNPKSVPRVFDYSSRTRLGQLAKFCYLYDDGCFYGLYRRELVGKAHQPVWWWINSKTPYNTAYPFMFYFLSAGRFAFVGSKPLWHNRVLDNSPHFVPYKHTWLLSYFALVLRKINVLWESLRNVHRGSQSVFLVLLILPALIGRCLFDCSVPLVSRLRYQIRLFPVIFRNKIGRAFRQLRSYHQGS